MSFKEFFRAAVFRRLVNSGRDWEVLLDGKSLGFADGLLIDAYRQTHRREVNNALYVNTHAQQTPEELRRPLPTASALSSYPELRVVYPEACRLVDGAKPPRDRARE